MIIIPEFELDEIELIPIYDAETEQIEGKVRYRIRGYVPRTDEEDSNFQRVVFLKDYYFPFRHTYEIKQLMLMEIRQFEKDYDTTVNTDKLFDSAKEHGGCLRGGDFWF